MTSNLCQQFHAQVHPSKVPISSLTWERALALAALFPSTLVQQWHIWLKLGQKSPRVPGRLPQVTQVASTGCKDTWTLGVLGTHWVLVTTAKGLRKLHLILCLWLQPIAGSSSIFGDSNKVFSKEKKINVTFIINKNTVYKTIYWLSRSCLHLIK